MTPPGDLRAAIAARERARSHVRAITVATGGVALAAAGFIAYTLPAPAHQQATPGNAGTSSGAGTPATSAPPGGDDEGARSGDEREGTAPAPVPASSGAPASSHATSGGS